MNPEDFVTEAAPAAAIGSNSNAALGSVAALVGDYRAAEAEVARLKAELTEAEKRLGRLREGALPAALRELGYDAPTKITVSGCPVEFKVDYNGKKLTSAEGLAWLDAHGAGDLAKHVVTLQFSRGQERVAEEVLALIRSHPAVRQFALGVDRSVLPQTIAAYCRQADAEGRNPPLETLGVSRREFVAVKEPPTRV